MADDQEVCPLCGTKVTPVIVPEAEENAAGTAAAGTAENVSPAEENVAAEAESPVPEEENSAVTVPLDAEAEAVEPEAEIAPIPMPTEPEVAADNVESAPTEPLPPIEEFKEPVPVPAEPEAEAPTVTVPPAAYVPEKPKNPEPNVRETNVADTYSGQQPQAQSVPMPSAANEVKPKKEKPIKKKTGRRVLNAVLSVLLSIIFFALCAVLLAVLSLRSVLNLDLGDVVIGNIEVTDITIDDMSLPDYLEEQINEAYSDIESSEEYSEILGGLWIDEDSYSETIEALLSEDYMKEFVGDLINDIADAMLDADGESEISSAEIEAFLTDNADDISEVIGYEFTDENIALIVDYIEENVDISDIRDDVITEDYSVIITYINFAGSTLALIIVIALMAFFAIQVFLLNGKNVTSSMMYLAVPTLIAGIIFSLAGLFCPLFAGTVNELLPIGENVYRALFEAIMYCIAIPGLIALGIGMVIIILVSIISTVRRAVAKKKEA